MNLHWPDLSMGGYGFYVWGSYLFALIAFVWELVSLRQRKRAVLKEETSSSTVRTAVLRGSTHETTS